MLGAARGKGPAAVTSKTVTFSASEVTSGGNRRNVRLRSEASSATASALRPSGPVRRPRRRDLSETFVPRRIDVLLVDLVEQLGRDFPELPYGLVARCVDVARRSVDHWLAPVEEAEPAEVVVVIEEAARADLEQICSTVPAESV